jgi:eukaryotic-like serine/threonine-protein kinase
LALTPGTRLGVYEVTAQIGEGGMGQVFRATDTTLGREVAIKILPDAFVADPDRMARFEREAQTLASLNHPHIAAIYAVEKSAGMHALVMELVEGDDLSQRIARGAIPLDEALPIAKQIADALEAAHEQGIIHRDLKPANIKVRPDGTVKVLDFGLAKALEPTGAMSASNSMSPTITTPAMTQAGMILGTAAYMSPEQAKGKAIDKRADIWAFGCVLFEMLSGRPPFRGETVSETLADVMKSAPPWQTLSASVPANLQELIRRCLVKEPRQRIRDVGDVRLALEGAFETAAPQTTATATSSALGGRLAWVACAVALLLAVALAIPTVRHLREAPPPVPPEMRLEINTPATTDPVSLAISPDGQRIVFVATGEGRSRLSLRSLDAVSARLLTGTEGASWPFWSPDGRSIGFFADGKLKRIDIDGGQPQNLTDAPSGRGASWNRDGTIIFTPDFGSIFRILAAGGEPSPLTRPESPKQTSHRFPQFLPDGRHFLYYVQGIPESSGIYIGDLQGSQTRRLLDADSAAVYATPGRLLFVRQGTLFAQDFDVARLELRGNAFPVAERIALDTSAQGSAAVSASAAGPFVYRTGSAGGLRQFVWLDRSGKDIGKAGDLLSTLSVELSPDGRRVALHQRVNQNIDVWLLELGRGVLSRFTFDPALDVFPIWSPDGSRIVFSSNRKGPQDLYQKPAVGAGNEELLLATAQDKTPTDWSPDGRFLLYRSVDPKTGYDLWALPMNGDQKPFPVVQTNFDERDAQFSPDGKWIAYQSNESGRFEIYIQPFPGPGSKLQVSTNGGAQVRWGPDGKELFYMALDARLMAVPIQLASNPQTAEPGSPTPLFATRVGGALQGFMQQYDVSSDGQRFLMNTITEEAASPITVVLNWKPP